MKGGFVKMEEFVEMYLEAILLNEGRKGEVKSLNDALKYFDDERFCKLVEWCFYNDYDLVKLYECANNVIGGKIA